MVGCQDRRLTFVAELDIAAERKRDYKDAQSVIDNTATRTCPVKYEWLIFPIMSLQRSGL